MRIHSNILTLADVAKAISETPDIHGKGTVSTTALGEHGSRTHKRSIEMQLAGSSNRRNMANTAQAATWDEVGAVLARIYEVDPEAVVGRAMNPTYADAEDFVYRTQFRYTSPYGVPTAVSDPHVDHKWMNSGHDSDGHYSICKECEAERILR